jgi:NDP-sugar pyrophosphorylase family protein
MQLIILCSGQGSRFTADGNTLPKPMLRLQEWSFLEIAYKGLLNLCYFENTYVTVLKEHVEAFNINRFVFETVPEAKVITLDTLTSGPAESAFIAIQKSRISGPVLVADCDQIFGIGSAANNFHVLNKSAVFTFPSQNPDHSFAMTKDDELIEIVEKRIVSNKAIAGAYYFQDADQYCKMYLSAFDNFKSERFVSKVINAYVDAGHRIGVYETDWHQSYGTPREQKIAEGQGEITKLLRSFNK